MACDAPLAYPTSPAASCIERAWLTRTDSSAPLGVAFSGGVDSTALLVECAKLAARAHAGSTSAPPALWALHVHHGLQAAADDFEQHVRGFCAAIAGAVTVHVAVARITVDLPPGSSLEAQAREARYDALAALARPHGIGTVWLAQHADDQVETMLIALGRGAGMAGLAAMNPSFERAGVRFERPMLEASGAAIRQWAVEHRVPFVDDPSNADPRRTRNRLRAQVLPALESALPSFRETFARSARLAAQARALMHEIAIADLAIVGDPPRIAAVQDLSIGRRANVLRHWLRARHATTPSEAQVVELIEVITACTTRGHRIELRVGRGHVRRDGERLRFDALD